MSDQWSILRDAGIEVIEKGQPSYDPAWKRNYNTRFTTPETPDVRAPSAIAFCKSAAQVSAAVRFVSAQKTPFRVRTGGHSYEGLSLLNDGLIIDIRGLNGFRLIEHPEKYPEGAHAVIGAALRQFEVYKRVVDAAMSSPRARCLRSV